MPFKNLSLIAIVSLKRTEEHPDFVVTKLPLIKLNLTVQTINCGDLCLSFLDVSPGRMSILSTNLTGFSCLSDYPEILYLYFQLIFIIHFSPRGIYCIPGLGNSNNVTESRERAVNPQTYSPGISSEKQQ